MFQTKFSKPSSQAELLLEDPAWFDNKICLAQLRPNALHKNQLYCIMFFSCLDLHNKGINMRTEIVTVPCLADNYAYIIHDKSSNKNSLIDAPQAGPILKALKEKGWSLDFILITHHHSDHIDAIEELKALFDPIIFGAQKDVHRLPKLDVSLSDKEKFSTGGLIFKCFEVPGHTSGHLAFYCQSEGIG